VPVDELHALRMVIQQLSAKNSSYRIVVYGGRDKPRHAEFPSAEALLGALCAAAPDLDLSKLSLNPMREGKGSIVFAEEIALKTSQLSALGLR